MYFMKLFDHFYFLHVFKHQRTFFVTYHGNDQLKKLENFLNLDCFLY